MDETAPEIRPDAIVLTLIQLKLGSQLVYDKINQAMIALRHNNFA